MMGTGTALRATAPEQHDTHDASASPETMSATTHAVHAVDRALSILCAFSRESPALGVTELSERLNLTKSTVHRILQVLVARGMVAREGGHGRRYTLGYRVLALAHAVPGEATLRHICRPYMLDLRAATEETISLYVVAGDVRVCVEEYESPQLLRMAAGIGRCFPLNRGAAGKVLLVGTSEQDDLWRTASAGLSDEEHHRLLSDLEEIRHRGYATTAGETVAGSASIAAPIISAEGQVLASLSVAAPAIRLTSDAIARYGELLREASAHIARELALGGLTALSAPRATGAARQAQTRV